MTPTATPKIPLAAALAVRAERKRRQGLLVSPAKLAETITNGKWVPAPHLELLSKCVVDAVEGGQPRLIVTMPPRHGKSVLVSHYAPVWFLEKWPEKKVILASYEAEFAASWGRRVRNTFTQYPVMFGTKLSGDNKAADNWTTSKGGGMITAGVSGPITGKGGDLLLLDDPVKNAAEAESEVYRNRTWEWWQSTAYTRLEPDAAIVLVMTRWHEDDLAGRLLAEAQAGGEQWKLVNFPAVAEAEDELGRKVGDPLWPERYDTADLERIKSSVGSRVWNALYQQRPSAAEGGILKRHWWRYWEQVRSGSTIAKLLPQRFDEVVISVDCAFKDTKTADFVALQAWGRKGADKFLLDRVKARLDYVATEEAFERFCMKWPAARAKYVEEKANGAALISRLRSKIPGIVPVNPTDSKVARVYAETPQIEAGNVYLPLPANAPWVNDFIEECAAFPNGAHDDDVDAMTQALSRMTKSNSGAFLVGSYGY